MRRVEIILNPAAGKDLPVLSILNAVLRDEVDWDVSVTHRRGDATRFARRALEDGVDVVATYGGDGTVGEVASVLAGTDTPLAILSGGTGNGVARFMGLPLDLPRAASLLVGDHAIRRIDLGTMNGQSFILRGDVGFLAQACAETSRVAKDHLGKWAYFISVVRHRGLLTPTRYELTVDGVETELDAVMALVVNIGAVAFGHRAFVPDVSPDDGLLDLLVLTRNDALALTAAASSAVFGNRSPFQHWKIASATIRTAVPQQTAVDGELIDAAALDVEVLPGALQLVVPPAVTTRAARGGDR